MVDVNTLRVRTETLARKNQAGYQSSTDYNSDLQAANLLFYEYLYKQFEETQKIVDGLMPFLVEDTLPLTQGTRSATHKLPEDYYH